MSENVSFTAQEFQAGFTEYVAFKAKNGDKVTPTGDLLKWVNYQNSCRKINKSGGTSDLTEDKKLMLDSVDFPWKLSHQERWDEKFTELSAFKQEHGHCMVPQTQKGLGAWVHNQRKAMKMYLQDQKTSLTSQRIERLDSIGFEWDLNDWNKMFQELCEFKVEHGHCDVPRRSGKLGRWVMYQRERYAARGEETKSMDADIETLESIGFNWTLG